MKRLLACLAIVMFSATATAAWEHIATSAEKDVYEIDWARVKLGENGNASFWVRIKLENPSKYRGAQYMLHHSEVQCESRKMRTLSMHGYGSIGDPLWSQREEPNTFDDWIPDSMGEKVASKVCYYVETWNSAVRPKR